MSSLDDIYDDWIREPPGDYPLDQEPTFEPVNNESGVPMLIIINGEIHGWNDDINNFERLPYDIDETGKVVSRSDGC